jgi:NADH dehydrogenase
MGGRPKRHRVVILGGGFGGLYAAKSLLNSGADVTLIDRRNFHLFQPLLYQVATGGLSPGDICSPLRTVLKNGRRTRVWQALITGIDVAHRLVVLRDGRVDYDTLIVSTGSSHHYFGHDEWAASAPGLKSIEDATRIRARILGAFEAAERETDPSIRESWMTFAIVGGGPTGVELAGALAELAHFTLSKDFRTVDTRGARIVLIEATDRLLPTYPPVLSRKAEESLERLGVTIEKRTFVTSIEDTVVMTASEGTVKRLDARTILWAAGVGASPLGQLLAKETGAELDRAGRVVVDEYLAVPGHPEILVIGDLAVSRRKDGTPLPGTAPVAMQQGKYVARLIKKRLANRPVKPFRFWNKGDLAVIGRNAAVANFPRFKLWGYPAWLTWVFVHIWYLIEFDNKLIVMIEWAFDYFTRKRGARLITGSPPPTVSNGPSSTGTPLDNERGSPIL